MAKTNAKTEAPKTTFIVLSPLNHDQEDYAEGDEVQLTEAEAAPPLGHTAKPKAEPKAQQPAA